MNQSNNNSDFPSGYNQNDSCLPCGKGGEKSPALNNQCGYVQTWANQYSAQGLGSNVIGYQDSIGYPFNL